MSFIGKTKTLLGLNALKNLVSDSMAIDMGSASTIIAVRGRGIVVDEPAEVVAAARAKGLLLSLAGSNVVRLVPPLIVSRAEIDEAVAILDDVLSSGR